MTRSAASIRCSPSLLGKISRSSRWHSRAATCTRGIDRDLLLHGDLARLGFGLLPDRQRQNAAVELGLDALAVGGVGQREAARERAVLALVECEALTLLALLGLAGARDGEDVVMHRDVEVSLGDARDIAVEDERVIGLLDLERRDERADLAVPEERVPRQKIAGDLERVTRYVASRGVAIGASEKRHEIPPVQGRWLLKYLLHNHVDVVRNGLTRPCTMVTGEHFSEPSPFGQPDRPGMRPTLRGRRARGRSSAAVLPLPRLRETPRRRRGRRARTAGYARGRDRRRSWACGTRCRTRACAASRAGPQRRAGGRPRRDTAGRRP